LNGPRTWPQSAAKLDDDPAAMFQCSPEPIVVSIGWWTVRIPPVLICTYPPGV